MKSASGLRRRLRKLLRLGQRRGQRLVADHVDAALQELARRRRVHVVGRDDRHRLDAVLPPRLALGHRREVVVDPVPGEPERRARRPRLLRRRGQRARHQLVLVVDPRGDAVHRADEGVLAAADHAEPDAGGFRRRSSSLSPRQLAQPSRITRTPALTTSSSLSNSGRQIFVAAARSGSACPKASTVNQPS